jgi:hypothetical protein
MEQIDSHWMDFHETWCLSIFRKSIEKIQLSLKPGKNNDTYCTLHEDQYTFLIISRSLLFLESEMFQTKVAYKIRTHILCTTAFFLKSCHLWDNDVKYASRAGHRRQYGACALMLDTYGYKHTLSIFNTYRPSTATMVAGTRLNVTWYVHYVFVTVEIGTVVLTLVYFTH